MSKPEFAFLLIGLYHPGTVGLQEQRVLWPTETAHPLDNFPGIPAVARPPLPGLIAVADRLGYLGHLPLARVYHPNDGSAMRVPLPWLGDLLWAFVTANGQVISIDWNIKSEHKQFKQPLPLEGRSARESANQKALARHHIQDEYYAAAGIRSVRAAMEDLDQHVIGNLRQLFCHHAEPTHLTESQTDQIHTALELALEEGIPPLEILLDFVSRKRCTRDQFYVCFHQLIWNRRLRLDLFQPVAFDRPMHRELRDVLHVYANLFRGD